MFADYLVHLRSLGKRSFTFQQVLDDLDVSINSAKSGLYRMKKEGRLITPARGLYVIIPPEHKSQGSIPVEDLVPILMDYHKADYYVSLLSGALYHGASHQKPGRFQIVSNKRIKHPLEFGQIKIELIYKKSLFDLPTQDIIVSTGYLKIATPELVTLDLLTYRNQSGGLNHIATVLYELIEAIDGDKLLRLADKSKDKTWLQRLGYILEKLDPMDKEKADQLINRIYKYLYGKINTFIPLASELPKKGSPRDKKWMVIENTNIESDL